ncbi:MAG: Tol-Pal system beta propeller repeat protein TolB [Gammaproteobacteria bacterium]|jgi:TolB protein|nr:Tol-Pal system beta propeller repeat protein TolB [Gammaproteobacteria bacterium]MBT3966034.1 Tol-Pal system beta propeller repeat protein TolB [Gammaproteobacteria bacterium]MBT4330208.1 Tol-Pal system beta propeller repeat protein TolB [Gammaproteobacteria bacterium]MBT5360787.1 Tol-Pal system beta propeller repeat protein TolB [Gammaproteobacteria bacterium]MBT6079763.1 Tol-Pal system beta propeller repeat protein TolB [Gammaproteobacteria bacterium]
MKRLVILYWLWMLGSLSGSVSALEITITQGNEAALPIAVAPFAGSGIISNDLRLSGEFAPLSQKKMLSRPTQISEVNYTDWRLLQVPTLLVGRMLNKPEGKQLEVQLINVYRQQLIAHYRFSVGNANAKRMRKVAHTISNLVYKKLTGADGVFSTHVAYVSVVNHKNRKRTYTLEIADFDGKNAQVLLTSSAPLLSPSWSPDGRKLAYVSFENRRSEVWVQEVYTGKRTKLASFKGKNSAPAWSPDGRKLALSLSRDGNSEIYLMDLKKKTIQRLTRNRGADTEPAWSPDGKRIAFLSDRSGRPQIYQVNAAGGRAERLTFKGRYNTTPDWAADGKRITFLQGDAGRYRIAVLDVESGVVRLLSNNRQDESPSFAPNGRLIVYATQQNNRGVLEISSADGGSVQRLSLPGKDVREPAWSPFLRNK